MAKYDMLCDACGHEYEAEASMQDGPPKKCPKCKKQQLRQVWHKAPTYHPRLSPMHPRFNRGRGY